MKRDTHATNWRKSSYSDVPQSDCVEVAPFPEGAAVGTRDSKDPYGPVVSLASTAWRTLLADIKQGAHDLA
ncbi:DUF397 domain-containing protein [Actinomadura parmotrematis]|uniref:DUF397 domain-containing protein n=1 Tax=Actinomadura parmotrematis TaxID=2864039 RepID=A0ABS7FS64_9ACTN|nr:DUF397 domain-containing protein [Actinomadura parmotrematis]MBW8483238.1 DUF397 domain-containing protein [Actinomadura parmotrematis]